MSEESKNNKKKFNGKVIYSKFSLDDKKIKRKEFKHMESLGSKYKLPLIPLPNRKNQKDLGELILIQPDESIVEESNFNLYKKAKTHFLKKNYSFQNLIKHERRKSFQEIENEKEKQNEEEKEIENEKENEKEEEKEKDNENNNEIKKHLKMSRSKKKINLISKHKRNYSSNNINQSNLRNDSVINLNYINRTNVHFTPKKYNESIKYTLGVTKTDEANKQKSKSILLINRLFHLNKSLNQKITYYLDTKNGLIIENNEMSQKINQDRLLVIQDILGIKNFSIFCVFDGHGKDGHHISSFIQKYISNFFKESTHFYCPKNKTENIKLSSLKHFNITPCDIYKLISKNNYIFVKNMINSLINELNNLNCDIELSGSTFCQIIQCGRKLICINIGDSKAILINKNEIFLLSHEHKPINEIEKERIENSNGEIYKINTHGPYRVFEKGKNYPGIALSRSIGDLIAKKIGVISDPEIIENEISGDSLGCVIGSDGIWEYLSNQKVSDILIENYNSVNAEKIIAQKLIDLARKKFISNNENIDDVSVIVILFK